MPEEACYADDIGDYRWEGFPLAEKHAWMQTGAGPAAVQPATVALRELSARLDASDRTLRDKLHELGVTWSGAASNAATSATERLAAWVGEVGRSTAAGQGNVDTYGSSFATMKSSIPPPVDVPGGAFGRAMDETFDGLKALVGAQTDYSRQVSAQQAADQRANAALNAHRDATRHALQTFPVAEAPPDPTAGAGAGSAAALGPPGHASAGPAGTGAAGTPAVPPPDGRAAAQHPGPSHSPGQSHPSAPGAPADPGTSSASAGAGPGYVPPGGPGPAAASAGPVPVGPVPVGPVGIGPAGRVGPTPAGGGSGAPWGYRPPAGGPAAGTAARVGSGAGPAPFGESALPPRTGGAPAGGTPAGGSSAPAAGGAPGRAAVGPGVHGAPMGMGAAPGGAERYHRNQTFIPSDEPFHVEFADISPPVLGVRAEDEP